MISFTVNNPAHSAPQCPKKPIKKNNGIKPKVVPEGTSSNVNDVTKNLFPDE